MNSKSRESNTRRFVSLLNKWQSSCEPVAIPAGSDFEEHTTSVPRLSGGGAGSDEEVAADVVNVPIHTLMTAPRQLMSRGRSFLHRRKSFSSTNNKEKVVISAGSRTASKLRRASLQSMVSTMSVDTRTEPSPSELAKDSSLVETPSVTMHRKQFTASKVFEGEARRKPVISMHEEVVTSDSPRVSQLTKEADSQTRESQVSWDKNLHHDQQAPGSNSPELPEFEELSGPYESSDESSLIETPSVIMHSRRSMASMLSGVSREIHNEKAVISGSPRVSQLRKESFQSTASVMSEGRQGVKETLYSYVASTKTYRWYQKDFSVADRFYFWFIIFPSLVVLWYAAAVLLPTSWDRARPYFVWTPSLLGRDEAGRITAGCLPYGGRRSICSEGWWQVVLIMLARLSAYASYVVMGMTFLSKMHSTVHFFSTTYLATLVPFEAFHELHTSMGSMYSGLILLHTVTHFIRWGIRRELIWGITSKWGVSGIIGVLAITFCVLSMSSLAKKIKFTFENRFLAHWISFFLLTAAICLHHWRTRIIALTFFLLWFLDYSWGILYRTHRLEVVEFVPLPDGAGTQVLWRNPKGFEPKSGEFVKIQVPWLSSGRGKEWHPFSLYLQEETKEGLDQIYQEEAGDIIVGDMTKGGSGAPIYPSKTALILIGWQNSFASPNGKYHHQVKEVMEYTDCLPKAVSLVKFCRDAGVHIIHVPISSSMDQSKKHHVSIYDVENAWESEVVLDLRPQAGDSVINSRKNLCSFTGTNLEALLKKKDIETIALSGFRTNYSIESTMRTACEKGLNVITLIDSMACNSKNEQLASINHSFKLLSTPLVCNQFKEILSGRVPRGGLSKISSMRSLSLQASSASTLDLKEASVRLLQSRSASILHLKEANKLQSAVEIDESLEDFVGKALNSPFEESLDMATLARQDLTKRHNTTQIFVVPAGDWSKALAEEVDGRNQMRSCWMKGPFTSPYFVASYFSHVVLMASGIGITPALGVIGQYPGSSRTKILIWSLRSKNMVKFFAPLLKDVHIAVIFYTGKDKLSSTELKRIKSLGNIFIQQSRPKSLTETIASLIVMFEQGFMNERNESIRCLESNFKIQCLNDIHKELRATWVALYCGGSTRIRDELAMFAKKSGIGWECELFDW